MMCATCGCSEHPHHDHDGHDGRHHGEPHAQHAHDHSHDGHDHREPHTHEHTLEAAILGKNNRIAQMTRRALRDGGILALNLVSSPGAGKTTLLERTIRDLRGERIIQVIEGDQETSHDAERIRAAGAAAIQINTGTGCHLDAAMVEGGMRRLEPKPGSLLFIENVGNLVCPALFDLGERAKVVIASVTEGEDKPLKYPHMFRASRLVLLNKVDLLPYISFDVERFLHHARQVNSRLEVILVSAQTGTGLDRWYSWVRTIDAGS
jgi:hydrogenase nickel incorporation protein HypB